ncbi:MAG: hypothetical protein ACLFRG_17300 [Desulfococcaceae bacterium]
MSNSIVPVESVKNGPQESVAEVSPESEGIRTESEIFPGRTLIALSIMVAVLFGLLLWTILAPDNLLFSLAMA